MQGQYKHRKDTNTPQYVRCVCVCVLDKLSFLTNPAFLLKIKSPVFMPGPCVYERKVEIKSVQSVRLLCDQVLGHRKKDRSTKHSNTMNFKYCIKIRKKIIHLGPKVQ